MFQTAAQIIRVKTMADRGIRIELDTPELNPQEVAQIFELRDKEMWVAFKGSHIKADEVEVPKEVLPVKREGKTHAQRQRAVLFLIWKQDEQGSFDDYYTRYMNAHIEKLKTKLD